MEFVIYILWLNVIKNVSVERIFSFLLAFWLNTVTCSLKFDARYFNSFRHAICKPQSEVEINWRFWKISKKCLWSIDFIQRIFHFSYHRNQVLKSAITFSEFTAVLRVSFSKIWTDLIIKALFLEFKEIR